MLKEIFKFLLFTSPVVLIRFIFNIVFVKLLLDQNNGLNLLANFNKESATANSYFLFSTFSLGSYFVFRGLRSDTSCKRNRLLRIGLYSVVSKLLLVVVVLLILNYLFRYSEYSFIKTFVWVLFIVGSFISHFYTNQNNVNGLYILNNKITFLNFIVLFISLLLFFLIPSLYVVYIVLILLSVFPVFFALFFDRRQLSVIVVEMKCGLFAKLKFTNLKESFVNGFWITISSFTPIFFYYYFSEIFCGLVLFNSADFEVAYRIFSIVVSFVSFMTMSLIIPRWHTNSLELPNFLILIATPFIFTFASIIYFFLVDYEVQLGLGLIVMLFLMSFKVLQTFYLNIYYAQNNMKFYKILLSIDIGLILLFYVSKIG